MQFPLFQPSTDWRPPALSGLPSWRDAKRVAVDVETNDPDLRELGPGVRREGCYIAGVAFAIEDGPAFYLPVAHRGGGNLDKKKAFQYLRDQAAVFKGDIVGANLQYDLDWLEEAGVSYSPRFFKDVQVAEPLIDELQYRYSLDAIAERYGIPGKSEDHMRKAAELFGFPQNKVKDNIWQLPSKHVGAYAEQDVRLPLQLLRRQEKIIDDQDLWRAFEMECRLLPVLVAMRRRGVAVDFEELEKVEAWARRKEIEALKKVTHLTGIRLAPSDTTKATALAPCLEKVGVKVPRTPKADLPSITTDFLKSVDHEIGALLISARKFNKTYGTFVSSIQRYHAAGRIHCTFNQLRRERDDGSDDQGTRYGRLSCSGPNLQQQPARDPEIGPRWRSVYIPDGDDLWACLDYSQQEPRWLTHFAAISGCRGAEAARQSYIEDPATDIHNYMAQLTGLDRDKSKTILLGRCIGYGTLVHTDQGLKQVQEVTKHDLLWDGIEYVAHDGVIIKGRKECINVGGTWLTPDHEVATPDGWFQAQDLSTLNRPLGWFMASSPSKRLAWDQEAGSSPSNAVAPVVKRLLQAETIWSPVNQHAVMRVVTKRLLRHLRNMETCRTPIVRDFLTEFVQSLVDVSQNHINDTGSVESPFTLHGSLIEECFSNTWSHFLGGMTHLLRLTGSTMTETMNQETYGSSRTKKTREIVVFDILNSGPRNRFCIGAGLLASNCYGMGGAKFCFRVGLPTKTVISKRLGREIEVAGDEGQALLDKFDQEAPYVHEIALRAQYRAKSRGYIELIDGRRCRFPERPGGGDWEWTHKALNRLIQGCSAVQMKKAMVDAHEAGYNLQLQVHDEIDLTIQSISEAKDLEAIMLNAVECSVPHKVDIETGLSWGTVKKLEA